MKTVFIGGSRHISRLNSQVKARLDRLIEQNLSVFTMDRGSLDLDNADSQGPNGLLARQLLA
jgi:hypothetical protein